MDIDLEAVLAALSRLRAMFENEAPTIERVALNEAAQEVIAVGSCPRYARLQR